MEWIEGLMGGLFESIDASWAGNRFMTDLGGKIFALPYILFGRDWPIRLK